LVLAVGYMQFTVLDDMSQISSTILVRIARDFYVEIPVAMSTSYLNRLSISFLKIELLLLGHNHHFLKAKQFCNFTISSLLILNWNRVLNCAGMCRDAAKLYKLSSYLTGVSDKITFLAE